MEAGQKQAAATLEDVVCYGIGSSGGNDSSSVVVAWPAVPTTHCSLLTAHCSPVLFAFARLASFLSAPSRPEMLTPPGRSNPWPF